MSVSLDVCVHVCDVVFVLEMIDDCVALFINPDKLVVVVVRAAIGREERLVVTKPPS